MNRVTAYRALVKARKECRACSPALKNPAEIGAGAFDSDHLGPWSRWQGNLNATLLVIGQDWADQRTFFRCKGIDDARNPTNKVLIQLLASVGIKIDPDNDGGKGPVFLTNAILCLKDGSQGGMQAAVKPEWFRHCGERFLKPTIALIHPRVVATLGEHAYRSVQRIYGLPRLSFRDAVNKQEGLQLPGGTSLFPMYHCGRRVLNRHRTLEQQKADWYRARLAPDRERRVEQTHVVVVDDAANADWLQQLWAIREKRTSP